MAERSPALTGVVPYITRWSAERKTAAEPVVARGGRLAYAQERPGDRDQYGILWKRAPLRRGQGRPEFGKLHPRRQRAAMTRLWCQVCGHPADQTAEGILWLTGEHPSHRETWPAPLETADPPLCVPCAAKAVQMCPHLRRSYTALRVSAYRPVAVRGGLYQPWHPEPILAGAAAVYLTDWRAQWVLARQLIVALEAFTITTLDT